MGMGGLSSAGLQQATNAALTGISTASSLISVASNNIVNASTPNYTRKESQLATNVLGSVGMGVTAGIPKRVVDEIKTAQFRDQENNIQYYTVKSDILSSITQSFGRPGDERSLGGLAATVMNSAGAMALSPESDALKNEFLTNLNVYTQNINRIADGIQSTRTLCESGINELTSSLNVQLEIVQHLNEEIAQNTAQGIPTGDLEDQRDTALLKISGIMNVNVFKQSNGEVVIQTASGMALLQGTAATASFLPSTSMDPSIIYNPGQPGSLSGLMVNGVDITASLKGGALAAYFELRDSLLPKVQQDVDTLALSVRDELNAVHNQGTGYPTRPSITGIRPIANPAAAFAGAGTVRVAVVNNTNRQVVEFVDVNLAAQHTYQDIVTTINAGLAQGQSGWNANGQLQFTLNNPAQNFGFAIVSVNGQPATETTTGLGFSHYFGLNDLLVNSTRYIQDGSPLGTGGLANDLTVRSDIRLNSSYISRGMMNDAVALAAGDMAVTAGDNRTISGLANRFKANIAFPAAGNLTPRSTTFIDYANEFIGMTALITQDAATLSAAEQDIQKQLQASIGSISGVNLQEELANMMSAQRLYMSSVHVSKVARETIDTLLKQG